MTATGDEVTMLLDHVRPLGLGKVSRVPVGLAIGYTLWVSSDVLLAHAMGNGTVAQADEALGIYWRRIFRSGNARLTAKGRHHFAPKTPYVVMANHSSLLDIPSLMGAVPNSLRMVTKEELSKLPIWGHAMLKAGFVAVDRKNRAKAIAQLEKAKTVLSEGVCMAIFPEGTRSRDGKLAPFKKGGFHVAMDLGVPIIPTWIEGTQNIIPPDQFVVRPDGHVDVRFGAPITTTGRSKDDIAGLMAEVRASMLALSGRAADVDGARAA